MLATFHPRQIFNQRYSGHTCQMAEGLGYWLQTKDFVKENCRRQNQYPHIVPSPNQTLSIPCVFSNLRKRSSSPSKNDEQKNWLIFVLSYIQVYYASDPHRVPPNLRHICSKNHPLFTNAPGVCGKSRMSFLWPLWFWFYYPIWIEWRDGWPSRAGVPFEGIPVIITGDAFQLPVVNGKRNNEQCTTIGEHIQGTFTHFTENVFFLRLSKSVRQGGDTQFADLLRRLRLAQSTQADFDLFNTRFVTDLATLVDESPGWSTAPILTGKWNSGRPQLCRNISQWGTQGANAIWEREREKLKCSSKIALSVIGPKSETRPVPSSSHLKRWWYTLACHWCFEWTFAHHLSFRMDQLGFLHTSVVQNYLRMNQRRMRCEEL